MDLLIDNIVAANIVLQEGDNDMTEQEAAYMLLSNYPPKEECSLREAFDVAINALRLTNEEVCENGMLDSQSCPVLCTGAVWAFE